MFKLISTECIFASISLLCYSKITALYGYRYRNVRSKTTIRGPLKFEVYTFYSNQPQTEDLIFDIDICSVGIYHFALALLIASSRIRQGIYSLKVCISRLLYIRIVCLWTELASTMVRINVLWSICGREASNQIQ